MENLKRIPGKRAWLDRVSLLLFKIGAFSIARRASPNILTVLNYHRVDEVTRPGFDSFEPNVTASPCEFARQMDFVQRNYNVITCERLLAWMNGADKLPPYSMLITFDDGYFDNYANAYPVLKARKLPAIIFLSTNYMGEEKPFYWDYVSYCFHHTIRNSANLPLLGFVSWTNVEKKRKVMKLWIERIKVLSEIEKKRALAELAGILDVSIPEKAFSGLYLSWDQVREMSRNGIEIGSHTAAHPILTRIPLSQVEEELVKSKQKIEKEIEKPVIGFAYPNGGRTDFSPDVILLLQKAGYKMAFSLIGGAARYMEVKKHPYNIRRIFLSGSDTFPRFVAKLAFGRFLTN